MISKQKYWKGKVCVCLHLLQTEQNSSDWSSERNRHSCGRSCRQNLKQTYAEDDFRKFFWPLSYISLVSSSMQMCAPLCVCPRSCCIWRRGCRTGFRSSRRRARAALPSPDWGQTTRPAPASPSLWAASTCPDTRGWWSRSGSSLSGTTHTDSQTQSSWTIISQLICRLFSKVCFCTSGIPDPQAYGANTRTRDTARKEKKSAHNTYRK